MSNSNAPLPSYRPQSPAQSDADFASGVTAPSALDRDVNVMAGRFEAMGLPRDEFLAMCEKSANSQQA